MADSTVPTKRVPVDLSQVASLSQTSGYQLDVDIDGIPFNLKASPDNPWIWEVREGRKDQFDNSNEAGEQSFGEWWLRSQSSWHGGAGQTWLDSGTDDPRITRTRFETSESMDVFTKVGQATPRGTATNTAIASVVRAVPFVRGASNRIAIARGDLDQLDFYDASPFAFNAAVSLGQPATVCQDLTTDGERLFVAINGKVLKVDEGGAVTTVATLAFTKPVRLVYVKKRLLLAHGKDVYQVDPDGAAVALVYGTHGIFQVKTPGWQFTSIAEGPNGIYLTGYAGLTGQVWLVSETESGSTIILGGGVLQMTLPTGEIPYVIYFYVNSLFVLGTSTGARVGSFTLYGQPQFGPLSFNLSPVRAVGANGSRLILGSDLGVYEIDLSTQVTRGGAYAYAHRHNRTTSSMYNSIVTTGSPTSVQMYAIHTTGIEREAADSSGWLQTSWIAWSTTEPKRAYTVTVAGILLVGTMTVTVTTYEGVSVVFTTVADSSRTTWEYGLSLPPSSAYKVKVTFSMGTDVNFLTSIQVKALPQERRYESIVLPLQMYNEEQTSGGYYLGYDGFALDRIKQLVTAARNNTTITVKNNVTGESYRCQIRDMQYRQDTGIAGAVGHQVGGMANVVLRVVQ